MPTILRFEGYRVYFYSHEPNEPPHVHVDRVGMSAKFWLGRLLSRETVVFRHVSFASYRDLSRKEENNSWRPGMSILAITADERVADVDTTDDEIKVRLMDGRTISVPLAWYPRLLHASDEQRKNWEIAGGGYGIHWPDIDEDLSTEGLLRGAPAPRSMAVEP